MSAHAHRTEGVTVSKGRNEANGVGGGIGYVNYDGDGNGSGNRAGTEAGTNAETRG